MSYSFDIYVFNHYKVKVTMMGAEVKNDKIYFYPVNILRSWAVATASHFL